jgi:hypothetical protein
VPRIQVGSRVRIKSGKIGRVVRLDADDSRAYVQLDADPKPDGTPVFDIADLELLKPQ